MKKIYRLFLLMAIAGIGFSSCSDDSVEKTPLEAPVISQQDKSVSMLSFSWTAVEGASQYAYELYDANDNLVSGCAGVTTATSVIATGLEYNSTYTLKVWAFSPVDGKTTTSPIASLAATTNAQQPLGTPSGVEQTATSSAVTITWPEVENATSYKYTLSSSLDGFEPQSDEVTENSVTFSNLAVGDYTLTLVAKSSDENYSDSEPCSYSFSVEHVRQELWRVTGTYHSAGLDKDFTADMVAYDDGTYSIINPIGVDGYSIDFTVDPTTNILVPQGVYMDTSGYAYFYLSSTYYLAAYLNGTRYSAFEGDKKKGEVWFSTYLYSTTDGQVGDWSYDTFEWESSAADFSEICGTYNAHSSGYDYFNYTSWADIDQTDEVTITDNGDGTVNIYNFYGFQENFTATPDLEAGTLTIAVKDGWGGYFSFSDATTEGQPVVATINSDKTISVNNFGAWYNHYSYIYTGMTCLMTKQ